MEQTTKQTRGGYREGAGRKVNDRNFSVTVRISAEAKEILDRQTNKAEFIDNLLKAQK